MSQKAISYDDIETLEADRDEWKQQHENLLEIYHAELKKNAQLREDLEKGAGDYNALKEICDIADAMHYNNPNNEMIWEVFNIAAKCVGIRRRLPDEPDFE